MAATVREHGGACFESLEYRDTYRDPERLGGDKKSLLFSIALRRPKARSPASRPTRSATGSSPPAGRKHGAELRT